MRIQVLGVHPLPEAEEPCHLVEIEVTDHRGVFDLGGLRQPRQDGNRSLEQVPYLEYVLNREGTAGKECFGPIEVEDFARFTFFIHYLHENWQIDSPVGTLQLPAPTPLPRRLEFVKYDPPD